MSQASDGNAKRDEGETGVVVAVGHSSDHRRLIY